MRERSDREPMISRQLFGCRDFLIPGFVSKMISFVGKN